MTEQQMRSMVCAKGLGWDGLNETDGSHMEVLAVYNGIRPLPRGYTMQPTDPWCAAFVSAVGAVCGLTGIIYPECGCDQMIALYKAQGRWQEDDNYLPAPGDVIAYDWQDSGSGDCRGSADHVGLVVLVEGDKITVIEGNKSNRVDLREIWRGARCIRGYCLPDYAGAAKKDSSSPAAPQNDTEEAAQQGGAAVLDRPEGAVDMGGESAPTSPAAPAQTAPREAEATRGGGETAALTLPVLSRGAKGESVRAAQLLLIGRGYRCGPWGADADFGRDTEGGVLSFQRARGIAVDGIIGAETWAALLGLRAQNGSQMTKTDGTDCAQF